MGYKQKHSCTMLKPREYIDMRVGMGTGVCMNMRVNMCIHTLTDFWQQICGQVRGQSSSSLLGGTGAHR